MHEINFDYLKRNRKSLLIEKNEVVVWRSVFRSVFRNNDSVEQRTRSILDRFLTELKAHLKKGRWLIVTNIGSKCGFLDNDSYVLVSRHRRNH